MNWLMLHLFQTVRAQSEPHLSLCHSFSPGCSSEPGYFAAGDSLPGYAAISVGSPEDCAIKCARVEGCAAWAFALQNEDE